MKNIQKREELVEGSLKERVRKTRKRVVWSYENGQRTASVKNDKNCNYRPRKT